MNAVQRTRKLIKTGFFFIQIRGSVFISFNHDASFRRPQKSMMLDKVNNICG